MNGIFMHAASSDISGQIVEIRKFCTHDGPGIRTTVFLKGCPLRCRWCSNPETHVMNPQIYQLSKLCRHCGKCAPACPQRALGNGFPPFIDRRRCTVCGICAEVCPHKALRLVGQTITVEQALKEVVKDKIFYGTDGGLTLSGGEPLLQPGFAFALIKACRENGIGAVIDTSAFCSALVARRAAELADLLLVDIKHMDDAAHRAATGVSNARILRNTQIMASKGKVRLCLPLVPGVNDSKRNIMSTIAFAKAIGALALDVNPLHRLGTEKYRALGLLPPYKGMRKPSAKKLREVAEMAQAAGLPVTLGRMM